MIREIVRFYERKMRPEHLTRGVKPLSIHELDQKLLANCLENQHRGWEDFVDRFMGLVVHVINHTVQIRGQTIEQKECHQLCVDVFAILYHDSFRLLREFEGQSSLTTYLTVVVRRIVVRLLLNHKTATASTKRFAA